MPALRHRVRSIYRGPLAWACHQYGGSIRQADSMLLDSLSLWYVIHIQMLEPNGQGGLDVVYDCVCLPTDLDASTAAANGGLHSLKAFIQHHAEELHLLVQDYRQLMDIWPR